MSAFYDDGNDPVSSMELYSALVAEGFEFPKNVRDLQLEMSGDSAVCLRYLVIVGSDDLAKFARAIERMALGKARTA